MDMKTWDLIIIAFLVVAIIMFVTGNGDKITSMFGGKNQSGGPQYDKKKTDRASLIFCCVLLVVEVLMLIFPNNPIMGYVSITVGVLSLGVYMYVLRKYCQK